MVWNPPKVGDRMKTIHYIGIGGYGMSAIARVALEKGYRVTGSDVAKSALAAQLEVAGAELHIGHDARWVEGADEVVYSTAIADDHVEVMAAKQAGIPLKHRAEQLAEWLHLNKGIAVAGAHGKTTTSSMVAHVLREAGLEPTFIIGGEVVNAGTNAQAGSGQFTVAEADESDGSFLNYHPWAAIVTNIEADHLEHYKGEYANLFNSYQQFIGQVQANGISVLCADDSEVCKIIPFSGGNPILYGLKAGGESLDWTADHIELGDRSASYHVIHRGEFWGQVKLRVPGIHNVSNSLAVIAVAMACGAAKDAVIEALGTFGGAKRRFQVIGETQDWLVVDDYAHHPTEISATLKAAKATGRRIVAIFQPQRYTRTYFLFDQFAESFREADVLLLTDIFSPAGEKKIDGVSSVDLLKRMDELQAGPVVAIHTPNLQDVLVQLEQVAKPGDLVLTMGAGDVWKVAKQFWAIIGSETTVKGGQL